MSGFSFMARSTAPFRVRLIVAPKETEGLRSVPRKTIKAKAPPIIANRPICIPLEHTSLHWIGNSFKGVADG